MKKNFLNRMAVLTMMVAATMMTLSCGDDDVIEKERAKSEVESVVFDLTFTNAYPEDAAVLPMKIAYYDANGKVQVEKVDSVLKKTFTFSPNDKYGICAIRMIENVDQIVDSLSYHINVHFSGTIKYVYGDGSKDEYKADNAVTGLGGSNITSTVKGNKLREMYDKKNYTGYVCRFGEGFASTSNSNIYLLSQKDFMDALGIFNNRTSNGEEK